MAVSSLAALIVLSLVVLTARSKHGPTRVDRPGPTTTYYVSTDGSDSHPGTVSEPWRTVKKGLQSLHPGDTLYVRGGTYVENDTSLSTRAGSSSARITVSAYPGERPVLQGLLWLQSPDYWTFTGLNLTWRPGNRSSEQMVRLINGDGWIWKNSEIWGAHSYAEMLVAGTTTGQPSHWQVVNNCLHDTYPSNGTNQDQLIYANTGTSAGTGLIAHNIMFNAFNGQAVKLGGPTATSGGAANVTVRYNTIYNTAQSVLVGWRSKNNNIYGNILDKTGTGYGNIRGYQLTGTGNVAHNNVGSGASKLILNDSGYKPVADTGGNLFPVDPRFNSVTGCSGFRPENSAVTSYGAYSTAG